MLDLINVLTLSPPFLVPGSRSGGGHKRDQLPSGPGGGDQARANASLRRIFGKQSIES